MELDDRHLLDEFQRQYQAAGTLRAREREADRVLYNEHALAIPEGLKSRTVEVYSGELGQILHRAISLVTADAGPLWDVAAPGISNKAQRLAADIEDALTGIYRICNARGEAPLEEGTTGDVFHRSRGYQMILPNTDLWWQALADGDPTDDHDTAVRDAKRRLGVPIVWEHVPAHEVVDLWDGQGIHEAYIYRRMSAGEVLATWRLPGTGNEYDDEPDGGPAATLLAGAFLTERPTARDIVSVGIRLDDDHVQVALLDFPLDRWADDSGSHWRGQEQVIASRCHGMGVVPLAPFLGRMRNHQDPAQRYYSLTHPILPLVVGLDNLLTQQLAVTRSVAFPVNYIRKDAALVNQPGYTGEGDRNRAFAYPEGAVFDGLGPGEQIEPVTQSSPTDMAHLANAISLYRQQIERHTFGQAAYSSQAADSGYEYGLALSSSETNIAIFVRGLRDGWVRAAGLVLRALKVCTDYYGSVHIPLMTDDSLRWVVLGREHLGEPEDDVRAWNVSAEVRARPAHGEAAEAQVAHGLWVDGVISKRTYQQRVRVQNPDVEDERILLEKVQGGPAFLQLLVQRLQQRLMAHATGALPALPPGGGTLPGPLADMVQGSQAPELEALKARMGLADSSLPQTQMPGIAGGLPQMPNPAPPAPTPTGATRMNAAGLGRGGNPPGEALALPGGLDRVSRTMGRFG